MHIAIVGTGFSGVAVARGLLRGLPPGSQVTLLNASGPLARGLAYGTASSQHLLNVPAARMGLDADAPTGFHSWLRAKGLLYRANDFVPRRDYGDYLADLLDGSINARPDVRVNHLVAEVQDLAAIGPHGYELQLPGHPSLQVDQVVLALGNFAPACPHASLLQLAPGQYVNDPWSTQALQHIDVNAPVMLVGSGLTMLDVLLSLDQAGHRGPILTISRRGLIPMAHRDNELPPPGWALPDGWPGARFGLRHMLRALREQIVSMQSRGLDWRDAWVGLRSQTPMLWARLSLSERAQFIRHLQPYWDVHRHRAAPAALACMRTAIREQRLQVLAGRVTDAKSSSTGAHVSWQPRHSGTRSTFIAAKVINCSGPSSRISAASSALLWRLSQRRMLTECPLGLGLSVDAQYRLIDANGKPQEGLYYVGPLLKSQYWEATAVPELREHARACADACLRRCVLAADAR